MLGFQRNSGRFAATVERGRQMEISYGVFPFAIIPNTVRTSSIFPTNEGEG